MIENPPAFPSQHSNATEMMSPEDGMTLRDWFAGQAFSGAMTQATNLGQLSPEARATMWRQVGELIYEGADAMLAARAALTGMEG